MNHTIRINVNTARIKKRICPTRISRKISPSTLLQINKKTDILHVVIWICFPFLYNVEFKEMICWTSIVIAFTHCYIISVKHLKHCSVAWLTWIIFYLTIIVVQFNLKEQSSYHSNHDIHEHHLYKLKSANNRS